MAEPVALVNSEINGYRVVSKLIECPQTVLYRAVNEANLHEVVIKMLLPQCASDRLLLKHLKREAFYEGMLNHPSIVKGRGFYKKPVRHHFIMDYFPSKSVRFRLMDANDTVCATYLKKILIETGEALGYVHDQGIVHRDIKPENILVNSAGEAKLIDFALAARYDSIWSIFAKKRVQGTRAYMSPEQILGQSLDNRADIYSYGATMFEMVVGHTPFTGSSEAEILRRALSQAPRPLRNFKPNVTAAFESLVAAMLAKSSADRPATMREVADTLRKIDIYSDAPGGQAGAATGEAR